MSRRRVETVLSQRIDLRSSGAERPDGAGTGPTPAGAEPSGRRPDDLIVEEPLQIRLDGRLVATTMRTPGHDFELAVGLLHSDGLLAGAEVRSCRYCGTGSAVETEFNVVSVDTGGQAPAPEPRLGMTSSSCGVCGTASIEDLADRLDPLPVVPAWDPALLLAVVDRVAERQELFARTGAVHGAAAFDRQGVIGVVREDIGRHNAVDKVVGAMVLDGALPARGQGLYVSGRASFEMVQKAWAAGFEALVSVSAPSALAVETARRAGLTLVGFVRNGAGNLYWQPPSGQDVDE